MAFRQTEQQSNITFVEATQNAPTRPRQQETTSTRRLTPTERREQLYAAFDADINEIVEDLLALD